MNDTLTLPETENRPVPKVSVCVVTYNQEKYIEECLLSIINQATEFAYEIIVSDDCSTDRTPEIISNLEKIYPNLIRTIQRSNNIGVFKNFTETHNLAHGEFVCHCDGDDRFLPGKLQAQYDFLTKNESYSVCWHRVNIFTDDGRFAAGTEQDYSMLRNGEVTLSQALRIGSVAAHSSCMYRKSARITTNPDFPTLDAYYTWEFLLSGKGKVIDQILGEYRLASSGTARTNLNLRRLIADHAFRFLARVPQEQSNIFTFFVTNLIIDLKNRRPTAILFLKGALKSFSFISPIFLFRHLIIASKVRLPIPRKK